MAGIFTKMAIATTVFTFILFITSWAMVDLGNSYGVTVEDIYLENNPDLRSQSDAINLESLDISQESSLDEDATDAAQAQGDLSANRNQLKQTTIIEQVLSNIQNILPYNVAINYLLIAILSILAVAGGVYLLTGRYG